MPPRRDPDGAIQMHLRALAVAAGEDPASVISEWHQRCVAIEWAGTPAPESERLALQHIEARLC